MKDNLSMRAWKSRGWNGGWDRIGVAVLGWVGVLRDVAVQFFGIMTK